MIDAVNVVDIIVYISVEMIKLEFVGHLSKTSGTRWEVLSYRHHN